jgi:hypothetical protein
MWLALALLTLSQLPCPADREVSVDLARWSKSLKAAAPADYDRWLAQLLLPPVSGPAAALEAPPRSASVSVSTARAGGRPGPDRLVVVDIATSDAWHFYRVQVLRPVRPGVLCALGADLSQDVQLARASPCPAGEGEPDTFTTVEHRFTPLTDPLRDSVEVVVQMTQSSCRGINGVQTSHSFWEAPDNALRRVLDLSEGSYGVTAESSRTREWFTLSGRVPRVAEQFRERCVRDESSPDAGERCSTERTRFLPGYLADPPDGGASPQAQ